MDNYHVIVVDDDVLNLTAARNLLKESGMRVSAVRSGRELLAFMANNKPDIILMDVMMPEMDGFETFKLLRQLEADENRRQTPVIFLTGNNDTEAEKTGLILGAADFIRKPFDKDVLFSRITNTVVNARTIDSLTDEAVTDGLTGFINKTNAEERLGSLCKNDNGALVMFDLDNFKLVNDLHGHDMGDQVLMAFADILRKNTRSGDTICRIGGDEFCAFLKGAFDNLAVRRFSERLNGELTAACKRLIGEDMDIPIGISIGAVFVPEYGRDYAELFKLADKSLYLVKQNGKHGSMVYSDDNDPEELDDDDPAKLMGRLSCMMDERNDTGSALMLGREAFTWLYQYIIRFRKRYGGIIVKLLFSFKKKNENEDITPFMEKFSGVLSETLRRSDIIMKYGENRFFMLMPEQKEDDSEIIVERIIKAWESVPEHEDVEYTYAMDEIDFG